jgi:hypothetical protein
MRTANFYFAILIATAVGSIVFMITVTLMQDEIFGQGQEQVTDGIEIIDYRGDTAIIADKPVSPRVDKK